jgi:phage repressor protein C with HTH and peptisase S24 domain
MDDVRNTLEHLIRERGSDYVSLSRLLGRNAAYMQQFVKRGTPRKLDEEDRRTLARFFGVDEALLGAPEPLPSAAKRRTDPLVAVPRLALGASAGPGAVAADEAARSRMGFDRAFLRKLSASSDMLSIIQVAGDSMHPTLADGDDILVDRADGVDQLRDGIYVLRADDVLIVKRIAVGPERRLTIRSDNPTYPDWADCDPATLRIIGRVIWFGRKVN